MNRHEIRYLEYAAYVATIMFLTFSAKADEFDKIFPTVLINLCAVKSPEPWSQPASIQAMRSELEFYIQSESFQLKHLQCVISGCNREGELANFEGLEKSLDRAREVKNGIGALKDAIESSRRTGKIDPRVKPALKRVSAHSGMGGDFPSPDVKQWLEAVDDGQPAPPSLLNDDFHATVAAADIEAATQLASEEKGYRDTETKIKKSQDLIENHSGMESRRAIVSNWELFRDHNRSFINWFQQVHQFPPIGYQSCGLTEAEQLALAVYSQNFYIEVNKALRKSDTGVQKYRGVIAVMKSALKKLNPYKGVVRRMIKSTPDVDRLYSSTDGLVVEKAFVSSSIGDIRFAGDVTIDIQSRSGRLIAPYSRIFEEHEVLFPPGCKFKIVSVAPSHITLDEISCPLD